MHDPSAQQALHYWRGRAESLENWGIVGCYMLEKVLRDFAKSLVYLMRCKFNRVNTKACFKTK